MHHSLFAHKVTPTLRVALIALIVLSLGWLALARPTQADAKPRRSGISKHIDCGPEKKQDGTKDGAAASSNTLRSSSVATINTSYYLDCLNGNDANDGLSPATAWKTMAKVNGTVFGPGDSILLKRGQICSGMLAPQGSGTASAPITIGSYGTGALPVISAGTNQAAIKLFNQEYWKIENVETTGGSPYGIYIAGNNDTVLDYFRITNVVVHDVTGTLVDKENGLIIITPESAGTTFNDVVIDGATAYNTTQWAGIMVGGDDYGRLQTSPRSTNITIRNSTVHTVNGDGIVLYQVNNGLMEHNVTYDTGNQPNTTIGTPNGLWQWMCGNCTVQYNEVYTADSAGIDGGAYDIDYGSSNNTVQYNYAHDNMGYCISVFAAESTTSNSIVRYNVCSNNARDASAASQGDIYVFVWSGGKIDGLQIYNNTIYWNPAANQYAIYTNGAVYIGTQPRFIRNNIIYSTVPRMAWYSKADVLTVNNNLYWYTGAGSPEWKTFAQTYTSFSAFQSGTGHDANGLYANPLLNDPTYHANGMPTSSFTLQAGSPAVNAGANVGGMGSRDFFGNAIPQGGAYDIGAHESGGTTSPTNTPTPVPPTNTPTRTATPVGPTNTPTATPVGPTNTPTRTATPIPPTNTPAPGGTNLALNKAVTVSSTESAINYPGAKAVDGIATTYWRSQKRSGLAAEWISVDLGANTSVSSVVLNWNSYYATSYTIQVSTDNVNWTTVSTTTGGNGGIDTLTFAATTARYVRMHSTAWNNTTERCRLNEFEIYQ
jgi:hypothetical protein